MLIARKEFKVFLHVSERFLDFAPNDNSTHKYSLQVAILLLYSALTASGA